MCLTPSQLVLLNSKDRTSGQANSGTYSIAVCQSQVAKVRLENFVVFNGFQAITPANGTFTVTETIAGAETFTISSGTYNIVQFASELTALLASAGVLQNTYTVSVSPTTLALTIIATGGALDTFSLSWGTAGYVMGWGLSPAPTAAALIQVSPFAVQLGNLNKLLIRLETNQGGQMVWSSMNTTASFVVDIDVPFGSYFSYTPPVETFNCAIFPQPIIPRQIRIELIDASTGALVDLRGAEFQIELAFWPACE